MLYRKPNCAFCQKFDPQLDPSGGGAFAFRIARNIVYEDSRNRNRYEHDDLTEATAGSNQEESAEERILRVERLTNLVIRILENKHWNPFQKVVSLDFLIPIEYIEKSVRTERGNNFEARSRLIAGLTEGPFGLMYDTYKKVMTEYGSIDTRRMRNADWNFLIELDGIVDSDELPAAKRNGTKWKDTRLRDYHPPARLPDRIYLFFRRTLTTYLDEVDKEFRGRSSAESKGVSDE